MAFADRIFALEARLLTRFGGNGTLTSVATRFDPNTGLMVEQAATSRNVRMAVKPVERLDDEGRTVVRTVAMMQVKPTEGETIAFAGETYSVGKVLTFYEGTKPVLYEAELSQ